ncbi:MAG TPA: WcaF family extracellular polysaccharide biosynthesis acetyltransferase [Pedobacter sp.]|nr:WcaF family extracellular polysaccharide biosynthesis acetyltransferase [Pedobacter sp.]
MLSVRLQKKFDKKEFSTGASIFKMSCWYLINLLLFRSGLIPFSTILVIILRLFGARIGKNVRIKPHIHIKYPWKLYIGNNSWLADCYIENLDHIIIGSHVCISQQAMLLTGNHNYRLPSFDLVTNPIVIEDGAWICAKTIVGPGVRVGTHALLTLGSVATKSMLPHQIYQGIPRSARGKELFRPIEITNHKFQKIKLSF